MKNKNLINPIGLKGNEIHERQLALMGIKPLNENENKSNHAVELTKVGPDGNAYAIVRENHEYYIKKTDKTTGLVLEDLVEKRNLRPEDIIKIKNVLNRSI